MHNRHAVISLHCSNLTVESIFSGPITTISNYKMCELNTAIFVITVEIKRIIVITIRSAIETWTANLFINMVEN
jgi:hypothetical protein